MNNHRQDLLKQIRQEHCDGKTSVLAARIGRDYSYVHRLFLTPDKNGYIGIGLKIMDACDEAFNLPPGFWGTPQTEPAHTPEESGAEAAPLNSPYARLLANTFDALGMPPAQAKKAFVAATQALIDQSHSNCPLATPAPAPDANGTSTPQPLHPTATT